MKIGIVCEGGLQGEDQQVLAELASRIVPAAQFDIRPQGNKPALIANCGVVTRTLLESGCCRVLVVWDVHPRWGKPDGAQLDSQEIDNELVQQGVNNNPCVFLVPIQAELEAWLLADGAALSAVLSRPTHPVKIASASHAHSIGDPKKRLQRVFTQYGKTYLPTTHAMQIVQSLARNFGVLGKIQSFKDYGRSLTQPC